MRSRTAWRIQGKPEDRRTVIGQKSASSASPRPGWLAASAIYLFVAAVILRTLALAPIRPRLPIYLALELLYLVFLSLMLWKPAGQPALRLLYFLCRPWSYSGCRRCG
jgi:hypothetical protein